MNWRFPSLMAAVLVVEMLTSGVATAGGREPSLLMISAPATLGQQPVQITVEVTRVRTGRGFTFTTRLQNKAGSPTTLGLGQPSSPDIVVFDQTGKPVWNCLGNSPLRAIEVPYTLAAHETKIFTCVWNGLLNDGRVAQRGSYVAQAWLHTSDPSVQFIYKSRPLTINLN